MLARIVKIGSGRKLMSRIWMLISTICIVVSPASSIVTDQLDRNVPPALALSAISPAAHSLSGSNRWTRVDDSDVSEDPHGLYGPLRWLTSVTDLVGNDSTTAGFVLVALYAKSVQFLETRSRLFMPAVYLCVAQRFP